MEVGAFSTLCSPLLPRLADAQGSKLRHQGPFSQIPTGGDHCQRQCLQTEGQPQTQQSIPFIWPKTFYIILNCFRFFSLCLRYGRASAGLVSQRCSDYSQPSKIWLHQKEVAAAVLVFMSLTGKFLRARRGLVATLSPKAS